MFFKLNPWLALILGILIGWLMQMLLEILYFRRRRDDCQRSLQEIQADLQVRDAELQDIRAKAESLEVDLTAARARAAKADLAAPAVALPAVEAALPEVALPKVDLGAALPGVELPKVELPGVELPKVDLPKVDLPKVDLGAVLPEVELPKVELPEVELPKVDLGAALPGVELPQVELPKVDLGAALPGVELPQVELPKVDLGAALPEVELPKVELPEVELPQVELPKVELPGVELPQVESPQVDLGAALPGVELPKVELPDVELPQVELPKVDLGAALPEVELPKVELPEVELPQVKLPDLDLPKVDLGAVLPEVDLPKVELPDVELPQVELPQVDLGAALPEVDLPKVELPDVELPQVELPDLDLPKVDLGAALPEVELPKVELPEVELPQVEVVWPEVAAAVAVAGADLPEVSLETASIGTELPTAGVALPDAAVAALAPSAGVIADDLTRIAGIGPKFARQLAAAGITSFSALAAAQPDQLKQIIAAPEWRQTDTSTWIAEAKQLAAAPRIAPAGDDLTRLEGVGPVYAAKLNAAGITSFALLADADEARLAELIQAPAWRRVNYGEWRAQAALAAAGDEAGLQALQEQLFSRKGDNLGLVSGLGEKTVAALGAAGITSYAALAATSPERLAEITRSAGVRGGDFAAWIDEAKLRAAGKRIPRVHRLRAVTRAVSCPQDLSRIKGIGSVYEQKLYAAGIGTFWDLAQADATDLARILDVKDFQHVDLAALKADALRLAEETGSLDRSWDGTAPDDFEPLEGIGEVYEGRLYDAGICTFRALANTTVEQLAAICKAPDWRRPDYALWIAQAKRLSGLTE